MRITNVIPESHVNVTRLTNINAVRFIYRLMNVHLQSWLRSTARLRLCWCNSLLPHIGLTVTGAVSVGFSLCRRVCVWLFQYSNTVHLQAYPDRGVQVESTVALNSPLIWMSNGKYQSNLEVQIICPEVCSARWLSKTTTVGVTLLYWTSCSLSLITTYLILLLHLRSHIWSLQSVLWCRLTLLTWDLSLIGVLFWII